MPTGCGVESCNNCNNLHNCKKPIKKIMVVPKKIGILGKIWNEVTNCFNPIWELDNGEWSIGYDFPMHLYYTQLRLRNIQL
jgi:hypothetical protein